jgi:hypothetical protein
MVLRLALTLLPGVLLAFLSACRPSEPGPTLDLPPRPEGAPGGSEIGDQLRELDSDAWERRIAVEIDRGNVPGWLRRLEPVHLTRELGGRKKTLTVWVTPDYLAVGSDDDFLLVPLSPRTAWRIADRAGASLPTPGMVDAVWAAARTRLTPVRFDPEDGIRTVPFFLRHDAIIRGQRRQYGIRPGTFLAGHKLDVVRLDGRGSPGSEAGDGEEGPVGRGAALYGWHLPAGEPIQPVFPVDPDRPPHFSVGVRLVDRRVLLDGEWRDLEELLEDAELQGLLLEGPGSPAR